MKIQNLALVLQAVDAFAIESLDVSARGLLKALSSADELTLDELAHLLLPRDYDPPVSATEFNRLLDRLKAKAVCDD